MNTFLSIFLTIMTALGGWFGFADRISVNPARITYESQNLAENADISVSVNQALKYTLTDASSLTYWTTGKNGGEYIDVNFDMATEVNSVVLREVTDNVESFSIYAKIDGEYTLLYTQDRVMTYRLCTFDCVTCDGLRIELTDIKDKVKIGGIEVYNEDRTEKKLRVNEYLCFGDDVSNLLDSDGFSDYFNTITDIIVFQNVHFDINGNVIVDGNEEKFRENLAKLRSCIGDRDVTIWCTILFQFQSEDSSVANIDYQMNFLNNNHDNIIKNVKAFVEKYGFDGVDFDWEHPTTNAQFKAYDNLILDVAAFTKVSIANVTWSFRFSKEAINAIDHFNIMSYDLFDDRGDHSDIYECGRLEIDKMIGFGVPKEKIFIGIPAYGRPTNGGAYWPTYNNYPELGKFESYIPDMKLSDEITCGVYFNSYQEARDKAALSMQYGVGGVMVFNLNSDYPISNSNSITRAIADANNK